MQDIPSLARIRTQSLLRAAIPPRARGRVGLRDAIFFIHFASIISPPPPIFCVALVALELRLAFDLATLVNNLWGGDRGRAGVSKKPVGAVCRDS